MSVARARVIRAPMAAGATPVFTPEPHATRARVVPAATVEAHQKAVRLVADAEERAARILADAEARAGNLRETAAREASEEARARLASQFLALRAEDERRAERDADRCVEVAALLAERLLGRALELDAAVIADVARRTLADARGARRARILACEDDARALEARAGELGLGAGNVQIAIDPTLPRGSLVVETDIGSLDARLPVQLERLAGALRDALVRS